MGLFSFLKNAGIAIFGKPAAKAAPTPAAPTAEDRAEEAKRQHELALINHIKSLGLPVDNFSLDLNGDKATIYGQTKTNADREKVILAVGNVDGICEVDDRISVLNPEPESDFYEVKKGDSLSKIAKHYYGDMMKYPVIFEANKPMLKDPNLIYPGQMLRIPKL